MKHITVKHPILSLFLLTSIAHCHDPAPKGTGLKVLVHSNTGNYRLCDYFKTRKGKPMGADHPIAWTHEPATGGRFFYTEFGSIEFADVLLETPAATALVLKAIE